jgi:hypothetical protein
VLAGLNSGLFFRFAGLSLKEMMAAPDLAKRVALFTYCGRLQQGRTDSIYPHNETVKRLVVAHHMNPAAFDWKSVNVRAWEYEREIGRREFVWDEALSAEQRARQIRDQKDYKQMFAALQPKLAQVFLHHGEAPPLKFRDAIKRLQGGEGSLIWGMGKLLYDRAAETDASGNTIREFMGVCPPFRALIYGMLMSWYDLAVRDRHAGEKFKAGRNDMFMSVYLRYCDKFVTTEQNGEQEKCLREVAIVAGLQTETLSYDDFCESFLVAI